MQNDNRYGADSVLPILKIGNYYIDILNFLCKRNRLCVNSKSSIDHHPFNFKCPTGHFVDTGVRIT